MKRILAERFNEHNPAECKHFVVAQSQEPQGVCSYKIILGGVDHPKAMYVSLSCSTGELLFYNYYYTMPCHCSCTGTSTSATESPAVGSSHGTYLYMGGRDTLFMGGACGRGCIVHGWCMMQCT